MTANGAAYSVQQERLQARLAEPRTAEALERLLDKLDVVAFGVDAIDSFLHRSEDIADSLSAAVQDLKTVNGSDHTGSDFVSSLPQLARAGTQAAAISQRPAFQNLLESGLIDQLGDPKTIANIQTVLGKLELAAFAMTAVDEFVRRGDEITDSIGESLTEARRFAESVDFEKLKVLPELLDHLGPLLESGALEQLPKLAKAGTQLIDSGLLQPDIVGVLAETGKLASESYIAAKKAPARKTSLLGLVKALQDPDINRAITLMLEMARQYGQKIR
jgi:uncharacterized protein YjgD (DUF1641 family)